MDENIFAYDEEEILKDSLKALDRTLDKINKQFDKVDTTDATVDHIER